MTKIDKTELEAARQKLGIIRARDSENYVSFTILAIILPPVGIVVGIIYLAKDDKIERKLGEHTLASSILFLIIWWVTSIFLNF